MNQSVHIFISVYLIMCYTIIAASAAENCTNSTKNLVVIKSHTDVKYLPLPTSDEPVVIWMDVQKGIYPNTSEIEMALEVGEPITIFIYLQDDRYLYDIMVNDCWAYDNTNFDEAKNKLHLTAEHSLENDKSRIIDRWNKRILKNSKFRRLLYTDLTSFKFPEQDQVYLKCDVQLCFKSCSKLIKTVT